MTIPQLVIIGQYFHFETYLNATKSLHGFFHPTIEISCRKFFHCCAFIGKQIYLLHCATPAFVQEQLSCFSFAAQALHRSTTAFVTTGQP